MAKSRPITSVHVDIARLLWETAPIKDDVELGRWTRRLVEALVLKNSGLHPYADFLFSQVEDYKAAEIERKRKHLSEESKESAESAESSQGRKEGRKEVNNKEEDFFEVFKAAMKAYPGRVNGREAEWKNFKAKCKDWKTVLPKLLPAIEREKEWRERAVSIQNRFIPPWANFQTWINQGRWEQLLEPLPAASKSFAGQL